MLKTEIIKKTLNEHNGIAKTADFKKNGLMNYEVAKYCKNGILTRIKHGYYQFTEKEEPSDEKIIANIFPDGIVCMDSALFYYGYSDRTPLEWTIAFKRIVSRSRLKIDCFNLKPYFVQEKLFELGKCKTVMNGVPVAIYDKERTICDCFKYRTKIDSELFNKAVNAYVYDDKKDLGNLAKYAKKMRLFKKVNDLIGVMING
jgi:predicted transcriptional regulator of viral defense system